MSQDRARDAKLAAEQSTPDLRQRVADALDVYVRPREWALEAADAMLAVVQPEVDRLQTRYELASEDSDRIARGGMQVENDLRAELRALQQRFVDVRSEHEKQRESWERLLERTRAENRRLLVALRAEDTEGGQS